MLGICGGEVKDKYGERAEINVIFSRSMSANMWRHGVSTAEWNSKKKASRHHIWFSEVGSGGVSSNCDSGFEWYYDEEELVEKIVEFGVVFFE